MATLGPALRKQLETTVRDARTIADAAAADAVARLGIAAPEPPPYLSDQQKALRRRLRAHARSLGDRRDPATGAMTTVRLAEAAAYEHWHRMLFGRFLVERDLLIHPSLGVAISRGELKELAEEEGFADEWLLVERFAAPSLPAVFKPDDPVLALDLDPHFQLRLRTLVTALPDEVFVADDSLGWTYQFWRAAEKKAVNERQVKIGADELPAVTQLFTEPYMVKFLLHNTLGAWWAGKVLAAQPNLGREAPDEAALRAACALPGVEWEYLRFVRASREAPSPTQPSRAGSPLSRIAGEGPDGGPEKPLSRIAGEGADARRAEAGEGDGGGPWRPAAGTFPGWPERAAEITYLDPCCGSGHFLVEAFGILAALRREEEGLAPEEAARAVLRDNLHGLEIDGRCVQIAAFNVALAAWRLAGGPVKLPVPHIAWVGAPPPLPKAEFVALANGDAELQRGLAALHDLFRQAPLLGSLIELTGGDLVDPTRIARLDQSIAALVEKMRGAEPERAEGALAARGMADAAAILARHFTLQATNVPFLGRGRQAPVLADYLKTRHNIAKADLATAMVTRMRALAATGGTVASVTPQNWLFLGSYKKMREALLAQASLALVAVLGEHGFDSSAAAGAFTALLALTETPPHASTVFAGLDAKEAPAPPSKAVALREGETRLLSQSEQLQHPDQRISLTPVASEILLSRRCSSFLGLGTGDFPKYVRKFWEFGARPEHWVHFQSTVEEPIEYGGREHVVAWNKGRNRVLGMSPGEREQIHNQDQSGQQAWNRLGVAVGLMRSLKPTLFTGEKYEKALAALIPDDPTDLPALWAFSTSPVFCELVRQVDRNIIVANGTLVKVAFDRAHWQEVAAAKYPSGLPEPYSDGPTQWLFHGHPRYAEPGTELHVALARLAG